MTSHKRFRFLFLAVIGAAMWMPRMAHANCIEELGADTGSTAKSARAIRPGTLRGCLAANDMKDTFVIRADNKSTSSAFVVSIDPGPNKVCVEARDAAFKYVASTCGEREKAHMWVNVAAGTKLYLQTFRDGSVVRQRVLPYTLGVRIAARVRDADEPNQWIDRAVKLRSGKPHAAYMTSAVNQTDPTDFYRIDAKAGQKLHIAIDNVPPRFYPVVRLYKPNGKVLSLPIVARSAGYNLKSIFWARKSMTYYIAVMHRSRFRLAYHTSKLPARLVKPYRITVTVK